MCDHTLLDDWIKGHHTIFSDRLGCKRPALADIMSQRMFPVSGSLKFSSAEGGEAARAPIALSAV